MLVVKTVLYVHSVVNNLISLFVTREAELKFNYVPKGLIKHHNLTNEIHCIVSTADGTGTELIISV